jgi:hypothetical protein
MFQTGMNKNVKNATIREPKLHSLSERELHAYLENRHSA